MAADIILIPICTYKKTNTSVLRKLLSHKQVIAGKTSTFALFLILFLRHQILFHAGDEIKTTGMFTVPSAAQ